MQTNMAIRRPDVAFAAFRITDVPSAPEPFRLVNRIPIEDNAEALVDLREVVPDLSYETYCFPYVRESVAVALAHASEITPMNLELRVYTALRTQEQQAEMYWGVYKKNQEEHPLWNTSTLRRMTNRFFAPPDYPAPPGHCTGGAVDVGLISRETGKPIDVRSPLEGWEGAPTAVRGLSSEAAENRRLLCHIMHSSGLSNCRDEYWHWSWGDSAWAVRVGAPVAPYGLVQPPPEATRVTGSKVEIAPYDTKWAVEFEALRSVLAAHLGALALRIEHVGSTAVEGLASRPILDVDIVIPASSALEPVIAALGELGYEHEGEGDLGIAGRAAFRRSGDTTPKTNPQRAWMDHHVYVCEENSMEPRRHLTLRSCLRGRSELAASYSALKRELAAKFAWDRTRYTEGKSNFIVEVLRAADPGLCEDR